MLQHSEIHFVVSRWMDTKPNSPLPTTLKETVLKCAWYTVFGGTDFWTDHCLVAENVRETLSVSKRGISPQESEWHKIFKFKDEVDHEPDRICTGSGVEFHAFLTSSLRGKQMVTFKPRQFYPRRHSPWSRWREGSRCLGWQKGKSWQPGIYSWLIGWNFNQVCSFGKTGW